MNVLDLKPFEDRVMVEEMVNCQRAGQRGLYKISTAL